MSAPPINENQQTPGTPRDNMRFNIQRMIEQNMHKAQPVDEPTPVAEPLLAPESTGDGGLSLIKDFEKLKLKGYHATKDELERGIVSVGYGSTGRVKAGEEIDEAKAEQFLLEDLKSAEDAVRRLVDVPLKQNEFDALVSLVYNVGEGNFKKSKALKALNSGDRDRFIYEAFDAKAGFTKQSGKVLNGLVRRRNAERDLFLG